ncbi:unnamed protein product [Ceutorhynchus assimilis]|uniref:Uncharacterized protein n=1 Tax=Ceutorhynchus assimilis TaxID=467358 RepID=A0A9N9MXT3_9CUCU|nr:unnamed protein product [Ceutorhynchus assimilis]
MYLADLNNRYKSLLVEYGGEEYCPDDVKYYSSTKLQSKIEQHFGDSVIIRSSDSLNNKKVVHKIHIDIEYLIDETVIEENSEQMKFEDVPFKIRREILNLKQKKLPKNLRVEKIQEGECENPHMLENFFRHLVQGPDVRRKSSDNDSVRIDSICQDLIFIVMNVSEEKSMDKSSDNSGPSRKRRKFDEVAHNERSSYIRKPITDFKLLPFDDMCFGKQTTIDNSEMQIVQYLPQINAFPTSFAVVRETLEKASQIADRCNLSDIVVSYDLAIARMAHEIRINESPIDSCGIVDILTEAEILAQGSVNSFIDCKHFNRCKRLYPILSAAIQTIHFSQFLENDTTSVETLAEDLKNAASNPVEPLDFIDMSPSLQIILHKYEEYRSVTLNGGHGKTAQFYLQYVEHIDAYFRFSRSIRTSNVELYITSMFEMSNLFFCLNQPNYARWSMKNVSEFLKVRSSNPTLLHEFRRGILGVKRVKGNFSRTHVDLTTEQTINADAANTLTGLRMLWMATLGAILVWYSVPFAESSSVTRPGYQINPKPCWVDGQEGTCMFVYECIKSEGYHIGMCVDTFMFGSCCAHNTTVNTILSLSSSSLKPQVLYTAPSHTSSIHSQVTKKPVKPTSSFSHQYPSSQIRPTR